METESSEKFAQVVIIWTGCWHVWPLFINILLWKYISEKQAVKHSVLIDTS